jgi:hypothetical protein
MDNFMMRTLFTIAACIAIVASSAMAQPLNKQMKIDTLYLIPDEVVSEQGSSIIHLSSQVPDLMVESDRRVDDIKQKSSGDWDIWIPFGTHRLTIKAKGFQSLELEPRNYQNKRGYRLVISVAEAMLQTAEQQYEIMFTLNQDSVYASYGDFSPTMQKTRFLTYKLPKGEYVFRFQKPGFADETKRINVNQASQEQINLRPGMSGATKMVLPGIIQVRSEPNGAEILINGQKYGATPYQGELEAGKHRLELRKPFYNPDLLSITVESGKSHTFSRILKPKFGYVTIRSTKEASNIWLDEELHGAAPLEKHQVESAGHTLRVETELHHSYSARFTIVDGQDTILTVDPKPAYGSLEITSQPEPGADVYLDGKKVGITPYVNPQLASGKYVLKVSRILYQGSEEELQVMDGAFVKKTVSLIPNFGEIDIKAPSSQIIINGSPFGRDAFRWRVAPGKYLVRAEREGPYLPVEREIFVTVGKKEDIVLEPTARMGSVSVFVEPPEASNAEILVNNTSQGNAPLILPLIIGDYKLTAKHPSFLQTSQSITIKENEKMQAKFSLMTYEGSRQQTRDSWATYKWIGFGIGVVAGGATTYFNMQKTSALDNYNKATVVADVEKYRTQTLDNNNYYKISIVSAGVALGSALISWIVQSSI